MACMHRWLERQAQLTAELEALQAQASHYDADADGLMAQAQQAQAQADEEMRAGNYTEGQRLVAQAVRYGSGVGGRALVCLLGGQPTNHDLHVGLQNGAWQHAAGLMTSP